MSATTGPRVKLIGRTILSFGDDGTLAPYEPHHSLPMTGDADELAEIAGRLCYRSWKRPNPATGTNQGYLANIIAQQHFSVLEHASATFWLSGVSRAFTHELVRHRHLSFSQVSQRYVDESQPASGEDAVIHPAIPDEIMYPEYEEYGEKIADEMIAALGSGRHDYRLLVARLTALGLDRKTARGIARQVLPNCTPTEIIVSGNLRAWREMLSKRLAPGADAEIREVAKLILAELVKIAPNTFQDFND